MFGKKKTRVLPEASPEKTRHEYTLEYAQIDIEKIVNDMGHFPLKQKDINEANTCGQFVLPFFRAFGWKTDDPFWSWEHKVPGSYNKHVDFAFSKQGKGWVYVEAKRIRFKHIDRNKNFVRQIAGYFNAAKNAHLIILTNGEEYCFYSYDENTEICATPFIRFNIRHIDLTKNAKPLERLFYNQFNIADWPKLAEMSRALAEIRHSLRNAPDSLTKEHLIEKSFALIYPDIPEAERKELLTFFTQFS
jgi:Uncharacterized conserved protein